MHSAMVAVLVILAACAAADSASNAGTGVKCRVEPHKPRAGEVSRAVHIHPPWSDDQFVLLRFPEVVHATGGYLFMCNWPGFGGSPMPADEPPTAWKRGRDGSLSYERAMDGDRCAAIGGVPGKEVRGLAYGGKLTPKRDVVDIEFFVRNDTDSPTPVSVDFCLVYPRNGEYVLDEAGRGNTTVGEFTDYDYERTFIHTKNGWLRLSEGDRGPRDDKRRNGRWAVYGVEGGPEIGQAPPETGCATSSVRGDEAIVVVKSSKNPHRMMAMAWPNPKSLMNNATIPCVHCSPTMPDLPARDTVTVKGRIYFFEGTLDELYDRYVAGFGHLSQQQRAAGSKGTSSK